MVSLDRRALLQASEVGGIFPFEGRLLAGAANKIGFSGKQPADQLKLAVGCVTKHHPRRPSCRTLILGLREPELVGARRQRTLF